MICLSGTATTKTAKVTIKLYKETLSAQTGKNDDNHSIEGITESRQELIEN